jgi:hypothetical protein
MFNVFILKNIRDCLLANPGIFQWSNKAKVWNIEIIELYEHLRFLRMNGFTRNDQGRVYWHKGEMADIRGVLSRLFPTESIFELDKSVDKSDSPIPKKMKPDKRERLEEVSNCARELRAIAFAGLDARQLQNKLSKPYDPIVIHKAVGRAGGTRIFSTILNCSLYYKFKSEVSEAS